MNLHGLVYNRLVLAKRVGVRVFKAVIAAPSLFNSYRVLSKKEPHQQAIFSSLAREFQSAYTRASLHTPEEFLMPQWKDNNRKIENAFLPAPAFNFLRHPLIEYTISGNTYSSWLTTEYKYLEQQFSREQITHVLQEDPAGHPRLTPSPYNTSGSSIHSLYHIAQFLHTTNMNADSLGTIIEWGGGYGGLAKLFRRLQTKNSTYVIIDTPLFSCLQWLYLSTVVGKEQVQLVTEKNEITPGKINLVPLSHLNKVPDMCDLFVSTWALSESAPAAQDYVTQKNWFGARHLLLAYQRNEAAFPTAETIGTRAVHDGAQVVLIKFLPGSSYAFK